MRKMQEALTKEFRFVVETIEKEKEREKGIEKSKEVNHEESREQDVAGGMQMHRRNTY